MTHTPIAAHARTLAADAETFTRSAEALRTARTHLREHPAVPPWLIETLDKQITACLVAAADFTEAATRLNALAARRHSKTRGRGRPFAE
jgi:hypothetical protein